MAKERMYRNNAEKQRAYRERLKWRELDGDSVDAYTSALRLQDLLTFAEVKNQRWLGFPPTADAEERLALFVSALKAHPEALAALLAAICPPTRNSVAKPIVTPQNGRER